MAHPPIPLAEIPTLTLLYKLHRIPSAPAPSGPESTYTSKAAFNDKISLIRQDITTLQVDAIVNAANNSLLGGGGVDGAIHRAAGPDLYDECSTLDGCETGSAKITSGYELPAKKVIHAVGPVYWSTKRKGAGVPAELLGGCYRKSLELATENGCRSVAFSALSTGVYGYPSAEACVVALETVRKFMDEGNAGELDRVVFCNFLQKDEDAYFENVGTYFPSTDETQQTVEKSTAAEDAATTTDDAELAAKLPNAPADPPSDPVNPEEPSAKKQKTEETADDFEVIDKAEASGTEDINEKPEK